MKTKEIFGSLVAILFLSLTSCSLEEGSGPASFTLKMPENFNKSSKVGALGANSCFAVSITGEGMPEVVTDHCDPNFGLFVGLVGAGQEVTLEVEKGEGRTIDLFYVNSATGCSEMDPKLGLGKVFGSDKVYRIGHLENVDINQADQKVYLPIEYPSVNNSIAAVESTPHSCFKYGAPAVPTNLHVRASQGAGTYSVPSAGTKMKLRITDKKLDLTTSGVDRILPAGVEL